MLESNSLNSAWTPKREATSRPKSISMKEKIKSEVLFFSGNGNHALGASILRKFSEFVGVDYNFQHINFADFSDREPDTLSPIIKTSPARPLFFTRVCTPRN